MVVLTNKKLLVVNLMVVVKVKSLLVVKILVVLTNKKPSVVSHKKIKFTIDLIFYSAKIKLENKNIGGVCQYTGGLRQLVFILIEYEFLVESVIIVGGLRLLIFIC